MSYSSMVIAEAEARTDAESANGAFRDRCEDALLAMSPAELAERVARLIDTETLFYLLSGQTFGHDYLAGMDDDKLAKFAGVQS